MQTPPKANNQQQSNTISQLILENPIWSSLKMQTKASQIIIQGITRKIRATHKQGSSKCERTIPMNWKKNSKTDSLTINRWVRKLMSNFKSKKPKLCRNYSKIRRESMSCNNSLRKSLQICNWIVKIWKPVKGLDWALLLSLNQHYDQRSLLTINIGWRVVKLR